MANNLTFSFDNNPINVILINGEPWFFAKEVCAALNIKNSRKALTALDEDEKGVTLSDTLGGKQHVGIISESGAYTLALRCRDAIKKGTKPYNFRRMVTKEILPTIRKTGSYTATINTEQQFQIKEAVLNAAQRTGETYQSVYRRFYNQFKIPKYQDLLAKDFDDAIAYLGGNRVSFNPEIVDTITHQDMTNISALCTNMRYIEAWWLKMQPAIRAFNQDMAHTMVNYFHDGGYRADELLKRYGLGSIDRDFVNHYPFGAGRDAQIEYTKRYKSIHGYR